MAMAARCKQTEIFLVCIVLVNLAIVHTQIAPDLRGKYCENRRNNKCCNGRQDECAVPILGTLCYCDDFCNRTRSEDCCPDFWSYCKGIANFEVESCESQGISYAAGATITKNCNECKCQLVNDRMEFLCETHQCLTDNELTDRINRNYRQYGFRAANYSAFWGRKYDEGLSSRLGTVFSKKKVLQMQPIRHPVNARELPRRFDARVQWPNRISLPKDQGWCGASWVFSTVSVVSDRFAIMTLGNDHTQLSPQHLLSCNSRNQRGCQGGHLTRAWTFIRHFGLVSEECYRWEGSLTDCKVARHKKSLDAPCPSSYGLQKSDLHRVGPVYRLATEQDVMYEIIHSGPVQAVIKVSRDFFSYKEGIYRCNDLSNLTDRSGYQAVRIVGWGEEVQNGEMVKYWIVSNSWGTWWGENGFFRIRRGSNECSIEEFIVAAWVIIDNFDTLVNTAKSSNNNFIKPFKK